MFELSGRVEGIGTGGVSASLPRSPSLRPYLRLSPYLPIHTCVSVQTYLYILVHIYTSLARISFSFFVFRFSHFFKVRLFLAVDLLQYRGTDLNYEWGAASGCFGTVSLFLTYTVSVFETEG